VKQFWIEIAIIVGALASVAGAVKLYDHFKEPLPNAQMTELKAEPPIRAYPSDSEQIRVLTNRVEDIEKWISKHEPSESSR